MTRKEPAMLAVIGHSRRLSPDMCAARGLGSPLFLDGFGHSGANEISHERLLEISKLTSRARRVAGYS